MRIEILYLDRGICINWLWLDLWIFTLWVVTDIILVDLFRGIYKWQDFSIGIRFGSKVFEKRWGK